MKKIILTIALAVSMFSFAQDKTEEVKKDSISGRKTDPPIMTISATASLGFYGISVEMTDKHDKGSLILNYNYGSMTISHEGVDYRGEGYHIEGGSRFYFSKSAEVNEKWYFETLYSYSRLNFNDAIYHGVYDYITPINAVLGYKIKLGKHIMIDPSVGVVWKIEIMSRGNVDNKDFNNWLFKAGVKVGYRF